MAGVAGEPDILHARIRSFHPRRSRTTPRAAQALADLLPVLGVEVDNMPADPRTLFPSRLPVVLEIGPGMGQATLDMAATHPDVGILAVDVHTPGVGSLLAGCAERGLANVRVCIGDAVELMDHLEPGSLTGIRVFFPDPWPKSRHHKRRLVRPDFVKEAALLLAPGGTLHLATDIADYADQMLAVCSGEPLLVNTCDGFLPAPTGRPLTKFELKGRQAGRVSRDLIFLRRAEGG